MINAHAQDIVDEDTWPPDQPKDYTPLALIQYQEQLTKEQYIEMVKLTQTGDIDAVASGQLPPHCKLDSHKTLQHVLNTSTVTKDVAEILTALEKEDKIFVLVEGAPGIGKSFFLKQIAYQWGKKLLLTMFKMVILVCLRDPNIWQATSICHLLFLFCEGDSKAKEIAAVCSDYLLANGGKDITFLFDGYDELPGDLQKSSLIAKILNRKLLPLCAIVVSSRPHTSVTLRERAVLNIEILGFTEIDRDRFIKQALKKQPQKIEELTQYLQHHMTINSLCFVPFNMVILLFLHKTGLVPFPKNSTDLYKYFICLTICRHIAKSGHSVPNTMIDLTTLPEPYKKIVIQLSQLSLEGLNSNKLVFTYEDIQGACPDMVATSGGTNGFGLLQAVQHFSLTGKTTTFNFLHLTIQEYLAAHYVITELQQDEELCLLHEKFWNDLHLNMFTIYVTLTKGQRPSFKKFLSGGDNKVSISKQFLDDQLKCIRLYRCFKEAGDDRMCKSIEDAEIFITAKITLCFKRPSATDLECTSLFLISSCRNQWEMLDLHSCAIQDHGLKIIHNYLNNSGITIKKLWLDNTNLNTSFPLICDIVLSCKVEVLLIRDNPIKESTKLYTTLTHPSCMLMRLYLDNTKLSSTTARILFTAVKDTNKLKELYVSHNVIKDDVADDITEALIMNMSLVKLVMMDNPISWKATVTILQALRSNYILQELVVPRYDLEIQNRIKSIEREINKGRRSQAIQMKLTVRW